ncbi:MAG: ABC-2 family transporter protein [Chloroflexota bacterium]
MNPQAGWALIRATWLSWMQHRGFFFILAFSWLIQPLVFLFVWMAAAGEGTVGGLTRDNIIVYYLALILINQLTYAQTNWTVGDLIRSGQMNRLLLYPMSPLFNTLAAEIAGKVVYMTFVIPAALLLGLWLKPAFEITAVAAIAFIPALFMAWLLRFLWGYWLALLAFWATRADALLSVQDALVFLLGGQVAPMALLPDGLRLAATLLPFRYMAAFPAELLTGTLDLSQIAIGLLMQTFWLLVAVLLYRLLWQNGTRQYTAVGG